MGMVIKLAFLRDLPKPDSEAGSFGNDEDKVTSDAALGVFGLPLTPVTLFLLGLRKCNQLLIS